MARHTISSSPSVQNGTQYIFFYGHDKEKHGDYACLSNFYPASFVDKDNNYFFSSEQYMMWRKAMLFGDMNTASLIRQTTTPCEAKVLGRQVKYFDQDIWEKHAIDIVTEANNLKFTQNPDLMRILIATGSSVLVEAAANDSIWGIGLSEANARITPPEEWPGTNWLGTCLMRVRDQTRLDHAK